jgi:predicted MFS family arabinose efflux permease
VVGAVLLPLAELAEGSARDGWLLLSFLMINTGFAAYLVNGNPFLMAVTGPEDRNHAFSVSSALYPLAAFVGSLLGGLMPGLFAIWLGADMEDPAPYRYPLFLCAALLAPSVLALLATRQAGEVSDGEARAGAGPAPILLMALLAISQALRVPGEAAARTFFNVYLDSGLAAPTALIGGLSAIAQLVGVPAALVTPLLMQRWGIFRAFFLSSIFTGVFLLPLGLYPHWGAAGLGFTGVIASTSVAFPSIVVYAMMLVPPAWRSTISAAIELSAGVSFLAASLGGGYIIARYGYPPIFLLGAALAFLGALLFWAIFRTPRGELVGSGL